MPDLNDERFETYLKKFHPLTPAALPVSEIRAVPRPHFSLTIWAVAGVVVAVILGLSSLRVLDHLVTSDSKQLRLLAPTPPLTVRGANALLAAAPSYKALMNELAFRTKTSTVAKHTQSALAVLGKEKIKL